MRFPNRDTYIWWYSSLFLSLYLYLSLFFCRANIYLIIALTKARKTKATEICSKLSCRRRKRWQRDGWTSGQWVGATKGMQIITISYLIKFFTCQRTGRQQQEQEQKRQNPDTLGCVTLCLEVIIIELSALNFNYENQIVQLKRCHSHCH